MGIGTVVLLLHDPADVVLSTGKFCRLIHQEALVEILFVSLAVVWFVTRIVLYPYHVIAAGYWDYQELHDTNIFASACVYFLCILYVLHWYWFGFLLMAIKRALGKNGKINDTRSDNGDVQ